MRQIIKKLSNQDVLFMEVPKDAINYGLYPQRGSIDISVLFYETGNSTKSQHLPPGNWQYICEYPGATEEQAAMVVEDRRRENGKIVPGIPNEWNSYIESEAFSSNGNICFRKTALESLQSLIKSVGIETKNIMGVKPDKEHYGMCYTLKQWQNSQAKVWEKVIILISK